MVPDYVSDGATLTYSFPFRLWNAVDLAVLVQAPGAALWTPLVNGVDFSVLLNGVISATVTLAHAQAAGVLIRVMGLRTPSRLTSVVNDGSVQSTPLESEFDVVEATMQELRRDISAETTRAEAAEAALQANINANAQPGPIGAWWTEWVATLPTSEPASQGVWWFNGLIVCQS